MAVQGEVGGKKTAIALKMTRDDKLVALQDIDVAFGSSDVKGKVDIRDSGPEDRVDREPDARPRSISPIFRRRAPVPAAKPAASGRSTHFVFSDAPVPFDALRAHDANGDMTIDRLILAGGRVLNRVRARFSLRDGKLDAPRCRPAAYGGTITGSVAIDATRGEAPAIALRLEGRGLDLAALLAIGRRRRVKCAAEKRTSTSMSRCAATRRTSG